MRSHNVKEETILHILQSYVLGEVDRDRIQHIPEGLIHDTFRIETSSGTYALQRLHPKLAHENILLDYQRVTAHLEIHEFPAPRLLTTNKGELFVADDEDRRWRFSTWLPGESYGSVEVPGRAYQAAHLFGRFHQVMDSFPHSFLTTHPLHNTEVHVESLHAVRSMYHDEAIFQKIEPLIDEVLELLPPLLLPDLPRRVVHGDPKISNFLFNERGEAGAVIDLDTCTHHSVLVDLGDAVRSWCRLGKEDARTPFCLDRFEALLAGYATSPMLLEQSEIGLLYQASRLITLELTARFLTDALEDVYFAWDPAQYPSRREHNIARAKSMFFLAQAMDQNHNKMSRLITKYLKPK